MDISDVDFVRSLNLLASDLGIVFIWILGMWGFVRCRYDGHLLFFVFLVGLGARALAWVGLGHETIRYRVNRLGGPVHE